MGLKVHSAELGGILTGDPILRLSDNMLGGAHSHAQPVSPCKFPVLMEFVRNLAEIGLGGTQFPAETRHFRA